MEVQVIGVDRLEGGVIVSFTDGLEVLYSSSLLRAMIPQAEVLPHKEEPEPEI